MVPLVIPNLPTVSVVGAKLPIFRAPFFLFSHVLIEKYRSCVAGRQVPGMLQHVSFTGPPASFLGLDLRSSRSLIDTFLSL